MEYFEEISFGKIKEKTNSYVVFHNTFDFEKSSSPQKAFGELSYRGLKEYLSNAIEANPNKKLSLYNGVLEIARQGHFSHLDIGSLDQNELEKLLEDSSLKKEISINEIIQI